MSATRPDIVLYCNHGSTEQEHGPACEHCFVVQRFRWDGNRWVGTRRAADKVEFYVGYAEPGFPYDAWMDGDANPELEREPWPLRCHCGWYTPITDRRLQPFLTQIAAGGLRSIALKVIDEHFRNTPPGVLTPRLGR